MAPDELILVTGVTGYVGGCLIPRLLEKGHRVRILVRNPIRLSGRPWLPKVEVVDGDLLFPGSLDRAMQGVSTAYYLVHNMSSGRDYIDQEYDAARKFAEAAGKGGAGHIIYLGGLADPDEEMGLHLRSRLHTGDILRQGSVPVTEFRSCMIIGSGSISFEMIRYLTEKLPILMGPRLINNKTQPIAIANVLEYLLSALENGSSRGKIYEIGGKNVVSYAETISTYARLRGLKRSIIVSPWMPVKLMASIAGMITPVPVSITGPLLDGMRGNTVVCVDSARQDFPQIQPIDFQTSVLDALHRLSPAHLGIILENSASSFRIRREGFFIEGQQLRFYGQPEAAYRAITGLGGKSGWMYLNWLWKLRGFLDKLVGGPGLRGRRVEAALVEGDVLDFYLVEVLEPNQRMRIKAELKAPGLGWMEWRIKAHADGDLTISQIVYFAPHGLMGFLYWYILHPVHHLVFTGLIKAIVRQARKIQ